MSCTATTQEDSQAVAASRVAQTAESLTADGQPASPQDGFDVSTDIFTVPGDTTAFLEYANWFNNLTIQEQAQLIALAKEAESTSGNKSLSLIMIPLSRSADPTLFSKATGLKTAILGELLFIWADTGGLTPTEFINLYVANSIEGVKSLPTPPLLNDIQVGYPPTWDTTPLPDILAEIRARTLALPAIPNLGAPATIADIQNLLVTTPRPTTQELLDTENLFKGPFIVDSSPGLPPNYDPKNDASLSFEQRFVMKNLLDRVASNQATAQDAYHVRQILAGFENSLSYDPDYAHEFARMHFSGLDFYLKTIQALTNRNTITQGERDILIENVHNTITYDTWLLVTNEAEYGKFIASAVARTDGRPIKFLLASILENNLELILSVYETDHEAIQDLMDATKALIEKILSDESFTQLDENMLTQGTNVFTPILARSGVLWSAGG
ncbi:MAG: hypothetical protein WAU07_03950 [Microgenomates group bacterium]